jgi:hypothetical protein
VACCVLCALDLNTPQQLPGLDGVLLCSKSAAASQYEMELQVATVVGVGVMHVCTPQHGL